MSRLVALIALFDVGMLAALALLAQLQTPLRRVGGLAGLPLFDRLQHADAPRHWAFAAGTFLGVVILFVGTIRTGVDPRTMGAISMVSSLMFDAARLNVRAQRSSTVAPPGRPVCCRKPPWREDWLGQQS